MNLGVDIGGTFTDLIAFDPDRDRTVVSKALNRGEGPGGALIDALASAGIERPDVRELTHGTTVVTNLLIERSGAKVGLLCTGGFRDVLEIQLSYRESTYDLRYVKTLPLVPRHLRLEVGGRIDHTGRERAPIDEREVERAVQTLLAEGVESIAVVLYNSYANPAHEQVVGDVVRRLAPGIPVTLSTSVDRRIGEYERVSTTVLNAAAVPRIEAYVDDLGGSVPTTIEYMHSAGGLLPADEARIRPIQLAFSGPAAGVLAGREVARQLGYANAITMDMGGTSCDVCLIWNGELRYRSEFDVEWGVPARVQSVDIHTVGAGGGSICWRDTGGALRVGPRSAGAVPGPVCYSRGGTEPTVTDANLVLGILSPDGLLGGELPLDQERANQALAVLGREFGVSAEEVARAAYATVNANMAHAIREITVQKGIDPRACALIAFGGAGAQHAAAVAEELGIRDVVVPTHGSVLSAVGLLTADKSISSARTLLLPLDRLDSESVDTVFQELAADAVSRMEIERGPDVLVERWVGLRYVGQSHEVPVRLDGSAATQVASEFEAEHQRLYGTQLGDPIEVVDCWVTLVEPRPIPPEVWTPSESEAGGGRGAVTRYVELYSRSISVYERLDVTSRIEGPCLVEETHSVTVVPPGATVRPQSHHLVVEVSR